MHPLHGRAFTLERSGGWLLLFAALTIYCCSLAGGAGAQMIDTAEELSTKLWDRARREAMIKVRVATPTAAKQFGTAFMITNDYALTAGHVICDENDPHTRIPLDNIELYMGGGGTAPIHPTVTDCYPFNADFGLIQIDRPTNGRPHLEAGAYEDLELEHFISIFGFGGNQPGRPLKGTVSFPLDNLHRLQAAITAVPGDSGAPVLDRDGGVVGVLVAGNQVGTAAVVPLRFFTPLLDSLSIFLPRPKASRVQVADVPVSGPAPASGMSIGGVVTVELPPAAGGSPPKRPAMADEVLVYVTLQEQAGSSQFNVATADGGRWSLPLATAVPDGGLQFVAYVASQEDLNRIRQPALFRADPIYGKLMAGTIGNVLNFSLYSRAAYVRYHSGRAVINEPILRGSADWRACAGVFAPIPTAQTCSNIDSVRRQIDAINDSYNRAYDASADEPRDIETTTAIASGWANFQVAIGIPCSGAGIMRQLFDKFSNPNLSSPLMTQTVDMIVRCLQVGSGSPASIIRWADPDETRQRAAVRLILDTLDRFAPGQNFSLNERRRLIQNVATAFELYRETPPQLVSEAASAIAGDAVLFGNFERFIVDYAGIWCPRSRFERPRREAPESVVRALTALRATGCT